MGSIKESISKFKLNIIQIDVGDIGHLNKDKQLFLTGRSKDTITLKNAKKINTVFVESIFDECSAVQEVFVKCKGKGYKMLEDI